MTEPGQHVHEVGGYRLLRRLGAGGMGTVHEAVDADGRRVALKLLHPHIGTDPQARRRLAREVSLLHRVRDAGVARVLDAEVEDAEAFVVTELVDGPTLEEDVAADGPFSPDELSNLAHGLSEALRAIHAVGVVHRDLKPGNVMMSEQGPVVIDFGIAQVADDARLTQTGMVTGTPGYLDPEVIAGAEPGPECDWWGWAAVLVFAATGRPPFGRGPTGVVLARVATGQVDVDGLPELTARALRAALDPDPARRLDPDGVLAVLDRTWGDDQLTQVIGATAAVAGPAGVAASSGPATAAPPAGAGAADVPTAAPGLATTPFGDGTRAFHDGARDRGPRQPAHQRRARPARTPGPAPQRRQTRLRRGLCRTHPRMLRRPHRQTRRLVPPRQPPGDPHQLRRGRHRRQASRCGRVRSFWARPRTGDGRPAPGIDVHLGRVRMQRELRQHAPPGHPRLQRYRPPDRQHLDRHRRRLRRTPRPPAPDPDPVPEQPLQPRRRTCVQR
ncbi:serine/threonine-protein kinase [Georgenia sp. SUBG003]|uniref:serine/threonine-protein kinase n=1 Tax=Georgenia sp. SUBG003 TaxID=1497974 RepID=UPI003AB45A8E